MIKVKVCGITRLEDALNAIEAGTDMLGYNFYAESPRSLSPETCIEIQEGLEKRGCWIQTVGIFVNPSLESVLDILQRCKIDLAQLSGDEPPELLGALGERAFKTLRPAAGTHGLSEVYKFIHRSSPPHFLIDAPSRERFGGTGKRADWDSSAELASRHPIMLAGGLTPANVTEAILQVRPWGVDVASGVESAPGVKDKAKIFKFIRKAKSTIE